MNVSRLADAIPPFIVMDVLERAQSLEQQGVDIVHLEVGEPDFDTPRPVVAHAREALERGMTHYTHSLGRLSLREAIAAYHEERYGTRIDPGRIVVTSGSSPALLLVFLALCDRGDEVILTDPHYACYPNLIACAGGVPACVPVREEDGFQLRAGAVRDRLTSRTRAILVNSPANPTGTVLSGETLAEIAGLGMLVISDEIYHGLEYGVRSRSILEFTDDAVVINGFSKLFAMTGWRLGYAIVPDWLVRPVQKLQQNFFISAGDFIQASAVSALTRCQDDVEAMRREYDRRRRLVVRRVREMGLGLPAEPRGAFYVFCNASEVCRRVGMSSYELCFDILGTAHVAVTPGTDFGPRGEGYLRISYAAAYHRIETGLDRLEAYLSGAARRVAPTASRRACPSMPLTREGLAR